MSVSMEEVIILCHENALDEMKCRMNRLHIRRVNLLQEMEALYAEIRVKQQQISAARDKWLIGGCV